MKHLLNEFVLNNEEDLFLKDPFFIKPTADTFVRKPS